MRWRCAPRGGVSSAFVPASTQVSFEPPPRDELTISSPSASATRVRPPGSTQTRWPSLTANGPQVDVAGPELAVHEGRHGRELDDRLRDPGSRVVEDLAPEVVELCGAGLRPDHDALAARAVDRLDHELVEAVHDLLAGGRVAEPPGVDVAQDRLLAQVVADQVGHVGVDELVVRDAVADGVGERHLPGRGRRR